MYILTCFNLRLACLYCIALKMYTIIVSYSKSNKISSNKIIYLFKLKSLNTISTQSSESFKDNSPTKIVV